MQITITSDDDEVIEKIHTADLDLSGHSLNWTMLEWRVRQAAIRVLNAEDKQQPAPS